ncbi:MAG: alpha/beta hydrolase [Candidatus Zixiibacteriota bacterium]|nr:MAG: alpha/beta hydrolase [candidate division Zixibacteria bacterium]
MLLKLSQCILCLLAVGLLLSSCQKESGNLETAEKAVVTDSTYSADSAMIHYDVRGSGDRALVFVHCWCCDRTYWEAQVDEFADRYKVVTIDLAGHGSSGLNRDEWTMEAYGEDVAAVVKGLKLEEVILIGHSMGGRVIVEAARRLPGKVAALVGVDTYQSLTAEYGQEAIDGFLQPFRDDFKSYTEEYVQHIFAPEADSSLIEWVSEDMAQAPAEIGIESMESILKYDYRPALSEMRIPILSISGDLNETDIEGNRSVTDLFRVKVIPATGHFPHMERPAEFNRLLQETIDEFWPEE